MDSTTKGVNGSNDLPAVRGADGRFVKGHPGGPGNPFNKATRLWTDTFAKCVTADDIREVAAKLVAEAKGGNMVAIKYLLDRCLGKSEGLLLAVESEGPARIVFEVVREDV